MKRPVAPSDNEGPERWEIYAEELINYVLELESLVPPETDEPVDLDHLPFVPFALQLAEETLNAKEADYKGSWKRRGGVGAFMMLARKWDRIVNALRELDRPWDLFRLLELDPRPEGALEDLMDLRNYLTLVEAEAYARGWASFPPTLVAGVDPGDGKPFTGRPDLEHPFGYEGEGRS